MSNVENLITTAQAADMLGCSIKTVLRWAERGDLPVAVQLPGIRGARMYRLADVQTLLESRESA